MYTGLIFAIGTVKEVRKMKVGGFQVVVQHTLLKGMLKRGSSVSVSGVCLTVVRMTPKSFTVDVMPQTWRLTSVKHWCPGTQVNLEPSLKVGAEWGGSILYGHVDGVGRVLGIQPEGNALLVDVAFKESLRPFFVAQGPVAFDGVSLTIVSLTRPRTLTVSLIPETRALTTLKDWRVGSVVNIEADIFLKYARRTGV
jgi:riboflavin synthase